MRNCQCLTRSDPIKSDASNSDRTASQSSLLKDLLQKDGAAIFGSVESSQSEIPSIPSRSPLESGADLTVFIAEPFNNRQPDEGELSAASDDVLRCLFSHDSALEQSFPDHSFNN